MHQTPTKLSELPSFLTSCSRGFWLFPSDFENSKQVCSFVPVVHMFPSCWCCVQLKSLKRRQCLSAALQGPLNASAGSASARQVELTKRWNWRKAWVNCEEQLYRAGHLSTQSGERSWQKRKARAQHEICGRPQPGARVTCCLLLV